MKTKPIRFLCLGDVVGEGACLHLQRTLPALQGKLAADFVIANGENSANSNGIHRQSAQLLFSAGVDLITTGNHVFRHREYWEELDGVPSVLRPSNYPGTCPGRGFGVFLVASRRVLVVNLLGTLFMEALASPFETMEKILRDMEGKYDFALCDFHAEATSEKGAFAHHFDGRVSAVFGTHTHVPTADLRILPGGTGFITDVGMCGAQNSVLGLDPALAVDRFLTHLPGRFTPAGGEMIVCGAVFDIDPDTGKTVYTEQVRL